jgi:hypothetical protein
MFKIEGIQNGKVVRYGLNSVNRENAIADFIRTCMTEKLSVATLFMRDRLLVRYNSKRASILV